MTETMEREVRSAEERGMRARPVSATRYVRRCQEAAEAAIAGDTAAWERLARWHAAATDSLRYSDYGPARLAIDTAYRRAAIARREPGARSVPTVARALETLVRDVEAGRAGSHKALREAWERALARHEVTADGTTARRVRDAIAKAAPRESYTPLVPNADAWAVD